MSLPEIIRPTPIRPIRIGIALRENPIARSISMPNMGPRRIVKNRQADSMEAAMKIKNQEVLQLQRMLEAQESIQNGLKTAQELHENIKGIYEEISGISAVKEVSEKISDMLELIWNSDTEIERAYKKTQKFYENIKKIYEQIPENSSKQEDCDKIVEIIKTSGEVYYYGKIRKVYEKVLKSQINIQEVCREIQRTYKLTRKIYETMKEVSTQEKEVCEKIEDAYAKMQESQDILKALAEIQEAKAFEAEAYEKVKQVEVLQEDLRSGPFYYSIEQILAGKSIASRYSNTDSWSFSQIDKYMLKLYKFARIELNNIKKRLESEEELSPSEKTHLLSQKETLLQLLDVLPSRGPPSPLMILSRDSESRTPSPLSGPSSQSEGFSPHLVSSEPSDVILSD